MEDLVEEVDMDGALRYTFPEWTSTIFGESPGDFNPMSNGMKYGLVWARAPGHYNDRVGHTATHTNVEGVYCCPQQQEWHWSSQRMPATIPKTKEMIMGHNVKKHPTSFYDVGHLKWIRSAE